MATTNWDEQYRKRIGNEPNIPRQWLVEHGDLYPADGACFESAAGLGGNLPYLLGRGYRVFAADLSQIAVRYIKNSNPDVRVIRADLAYFPLPAHYFSLISHFYFLDWSLMDQYQHALIPGGMVIFETLTTQMLTFRQDMAPERLLHPGELKEYFRDWDILDYREGWFDSEHGHEKAIASIIARKRG